MSDDGIVWERVACSNALITTDVSTMSEEFHDWLEQCPCHWFKKYGEATYTFTEETKDDE